MLHRLDVSKHADAVTVQSRLRELGYYRAKVDGDFGKGSKAALKAWCKDRLGQQDDVMTLAVQQELFKGTGR
jgi:peptidoglycan hydrolase-like protein with peptidoglycan-binding domain